MAESVNSTGNQKKKLNIASTFIEPAWAVYFINTGVNPFEEAEK
jgi:hypothetical protein